jgi:hypothetical protein
MFTHEMIDTSNDFMLIEKYEIMLVINRINEKNRRMFFDNIVYVSFIDVILIFVTRFKKRDFEWNMYKKALMNKSIVAVICDIEKKHDLFFLKYRLIEKFVNAVQSHKKILTKTISWNWHLRLKHCRSKMINQFKKNWWDWSNSWKCFENRSMRYMCDFKNASSDSTNIVSKND